MTILLVLLVVSLCSSINGQIPDWFSRQTQLCYDWAADGDKGQCEAASNPLCANINDHTGDYRDDSDNRSGGCQMRWGIISPNSPDWFKDVQICFKWYADGDKGQCGDHSGRGEVCASVGSFTPSYRDDTDNRSGGCRMSWRLKVPAYAPDWLLRTKLCFNWYADGDAGQCGGTTGLQNNLCASANTWTQDYRDDTDSRPGGCRMSWSIIVN